jgi:hypothetical protein
MVQWHTTRGVAYAKNGIALQFVGGGILNDAAKKAGFPLAKAQQIGKRASGTFIESGMPKHYGPKGGAISDVEGHGPGTPRVEILSVSLRLDEVEAWDAAFHELLPVDASEYKRSS